MNVETWFLTRGEKQRLRVFENWMLRRISGPKKEEVAENWRNFHKEEIRNLYFTPNIIVVIR
jgi:hypothetical protein